jgi:hypothetical protein
VPQVERVGQRHPGHHDDEHGAGRENEGTAHSPHAGILPDGAAQRPAGAMVMGGVPGVAAQFAIRSVGPRRRA